MFTDTKSALLYVLFCAVIPYLLGSLSFSIIVSRLLFRKDVRNYGSHNAGMTNVLRTFGKGAAALTLAGDIGKGVAAVLLAKWFFSAHLNDAIYYRGAIIGVYLAAFFAVIGHVYPLYFGFKGGKAVSVATGTIIALEPVLLVPLAAIFFVTLACGKMVSLASVLCATAYPLVTFCYQQFFLHAPAAQVGAASVGAAVVGLLVIWLHRGNIARIRAGTEYKFFQKKK